MEDIITRTRIGKTWTRNPMESKIVPTTSREDRRPERLFSKLHKRGSTSHLANTCKKKIKINEVQVIEEAQRSEEKDKSDQYCAISEETPAEDYHVETFKLSLKSLKFILTCYNIVNISTTLSISRRPEWVRLNPLESKIKLLENLVLHQYLLMMLKPKSILTQEHSSLV
ncbi:hypothetical protein O181_106108 [Austropuccinia psidii MF-1]|uniref:Uncharacterized protein n=1 Tax=Austropuccinia psidii MF-1 TaxID=1389203 RepID=A0A9Q3JNC0_9BASI|nr:hypothetical protein [Austropuccinia psidii MF-1]